MRCSRALAPVVGLAAALAACDDADELAAHEAPPWLRGVELGAALESARIAAEGAARAARGFGASPRELGGGLLVNDTRALDHPPLGRPVSERDLENPALPRFGGGLGPGNG